jgi:hypothetical protein
VSDQVRLQVPPGESARLAAARPGEVVEVRCGTGPLPSGGSEATVAEGGMYDGMLTWGDPRAPCVIRRYTAHPAPAVGAEVWVGPACGECGLPATCRDSSGNERCDLCCAPHLESCQEIEEEFVRATVTALGARPWCPECNGSGVVDNGYPNYEAVDCPTCQGTPPWWATAGLRRVEC